MPLYAYKCHTCGAAVDRQRALDDRDDRVECPDCGDGMRRLLHAPGFTIEGKAYFTRGNSWVDPGDL